MFIKKINLKSDINIINQELSKLVDQHTWGQFNQINLKSTEDSQDLWFGGSGSIYDRVKKIHNQKESDFTNWNLTTEWYVRQQIEILQKNINIKIGRIRFMKLMPKTGLSVHNDFEHRYHLVLKTNNYAYFGKTFKLKNTDPDNIETSLFSGGVYHIPADGYWYEVDTTKEHWVYNGGAEERIHLVVCGC